MFIFYHSYVYFRLCYNTKYISAQSGIHHDIYIYEIICNINRNTEESDHSTIRVVNIDDNVKLICYKQYHLYEITIYIYIKVGNNMEETPLIIYKV